MLNDFLRKYRDIRKKEGLKINDTVSLILYTESELLKEVVDGCGKAVLQVSDIQLVDDISKTENQFKVGDVQVGLTVNPSQHQL